MKQIVPEMSPVQIQLYETRFNNASLGMYLPSKPFEVFKTFRKRFLNVFLKPIENVLRPPKVLHFANVENVLDTFFRSFYVVFNTPRKRFFQGRFATVMITFSLRFPNVFKTKPVENVSKTKTYGLLGILARLLFTHLSDMETTG
jgi:hypothetical protein